MAIHCRCYIKLKQIDLWGIKYLTSFLTLNTKYIKCKVCSVSFVNMWQLVKLSDLIVNMTSFVTYFQMYQGVTLYHRSISLYIMTVVDDDEPSASSYKLLCTYLVVRTQVLTVYVTSSERLRGQR